MIVGVEHIAIISDEGRLTAELDRKALFVVPALYERLRLVATMGARWALPTRGQISSRLSHLDRRAAAGEGHGSASPCRPRGAAEWHDQRSRATVLEVDHSAAPRRMARQPGLYGGTGGGHRHLSSGRAGARDLGQIDSCKPRLIQCIDLLKKAAVS